MTDIAARGDRDSTPALAQEQGRPTDQSNGNRRTGAGAAQAPNAKIRPGRSLAVRVPLFLVITLSLVVAAGAWGLRTIVLRSFEKLEVAHAEIDLRRFANAIEHEVQLFRLSLIQAAAELESGIVPGLSAASPFGTANFERTRANVACAYEPSGALLWSDSSDPSGRLFQVVNPYSLCSLSSDHPLMRRLLTGTGVTGLIDIAGNPFIVASVGFEVTSDAGSPASALLGLRHLSAAELDAIDERIGVSIDFWSMQTPNLKVLEAAAGAALSLGAPTIINNRDENVLQVYWAFEDALGHPAFLARANVLRDLRVIGGETVFLSVVAMLCVGLAAIVMSVFLVRSLMVGRLSRLTQHILNIRRKGVSGIRLRFQHRDEIGILAEEFEKLLAELSATTQQLADVSYRAGRAEIAEGILHNIGNTLNSLLASTHVMRDRTHTAGLHRLVEAAQELGNGENLTQRQKKLAQYAGLAASEENQRIDALIADIDRLLGHINRIEDILESQRRLAADADLATEANLLPLVESAVRALPDRFAGQSIVHFDQSMAALPPVVCVRAVVLQILSNILVNATESIIRSGRTDGRIDIAAQRSTIDGAPMVDLTIADNGVGLTEQELVKVFQRHYTTKPGRGHGIGLHWSASVVANMRGRLYAHSDGPARGAVFHLVLPVAAGNASS